MRIRGRVWVGLAILITAYSPFFRNLTSESIRNPYAGHVALVPVLAVVLAWKERHAFRGSRLRPNASALTILGMAVILLCLGYRNASVRLQALSFIAMIAGLAACAYGRRVPRRAAFVVAFLLLMMPPPSGMMAGLVPSVQHFVAWTTGGTLQLLGVPVVQEGILLRLPRVTLEVAESCTGLRFLPILVVSVAVFARIALPTVKDQLIVTALSAPVAVVANIVRVTVTGAGSHFFGPYVATGPLHYYIGKVCWLAALLVVIGITWLLDKRTETVATDRSSRSLMARAY